MSEHRCPPHCHRCPDLDGDVMPMCWGTVTRPEAGLSACYCRSERSSDKEAARRLATSRFLPPSLREALVRWAGEPDDDTPPLGSLAQHGRAKAVAAKILAGGA